MALDSAVGGASADTYVTLAAFKEYASGVGISLNLKDGTAANDTAIEQALRRGTILVDGYGDRFTGMRLDGGQALCFPRSGATRTDGSALPSNEIPVSVVRATCWAAGYALANPSDVNQVIQQHRIIKREKVGDIERTYADLDDTTSLRRTLSMVEDLLADILLPEDNRMEENPTSFLISGRMKDDDQADN